MDSRKVAIIGGGPGGYVAAIRAAQLGAQVTLIERDKIGGTCLNRGCIPTKALLHDAKMLRLLRNSNVFQPCLNERFSPYNPERPSLQSGDEGHFESKDKEKPRSLGQGYTGFSPLESMMERKKKVVQEMVKGVEMLLESHRITVKRAQADLLRPDQLILSYGDGKKETVDADAIIMAPGSKSKTLPHIAPDGDRIITSDEALEIEKVPHEVVIVGGGYIGVEFAAIFNALSSRVTIVEILDNILLGLEDELVRNLRRFLERDGVRILTKSKLEDLRPAEERLSLTVNTPRGVEEIAAEKLLLAVGRTPSLELDFLKAGVEISSTGIRVNGRMETTSPNVYAVGDAIGGTLLAHVAMEEGIVAAENAMGIVREMESHAIPLCIFTYPEVASIGLTEKEAKEKGAIKIGRFPFRSNPTALVSAETDGLVKVIVGRDDDKILGVHIIGHEASTLISIVSALMGQDVKAKEFSRIIQAHPTTPEALKEAFLDAEGLAIHLLKPLRTPKGA